MLMFLSLVRTVTFFLSYTVINIIADVNIKFLKNYFN